tara:strand:- start:1130 stop:1492 length:363 start_codon:yes stop_codon:yes gene_type:complete
MKIDNEWYWFDEEFFEWYRYPKDIQKILKKNINKDEIKVKIDNKDYIFNFREGYDLEVKNGSMVKIKNRYLRELYKIEYKMKDERELRMNQHIYHNLLKKKNIEEKIEEDISDSEDEWEH